MTTELAHKAWELPPLEPSELGPYGDFPRLSDTEKAAIWTAYRAGTAPRVPVTLSTNNRVLLLDHRIDPEGLVYEHVFRDPRAMLVTQLRWSYLCRKRYHLFCDQPTELPERWEIALDFQNVYEAAFFG